MYCKNCVKQILGIIVILAVAISAFIGVSKVQKEKKYNENVTSGQKYLEEEEYEKAVVCFNEAIDIGPKQVEPYQELARAYIGLEDSESVQKTYNKVFTYITDEYNNKQKLPKNSENVYKEAIIYYGEQGDMEKAEKLTEDICTMTSDDTKEQEFRELVKQYGIYRQYYDLLIETQKKHGEGVQRTTEGGAAYLEGLCFAKLVDFNRDSKEELVLAYVDESTRDAYIPQYIVEVWRYENTDVERVFNGAGYWYDGGVSVLPISNVDDNYYLIEGMAESFQYDSIWELQKDGFVQIRELEAEYIDEIYSIDEDPVSETEYQTECDKWWDSCTIYGLSSTKEANELSLKELRQTMEKLQRESGIEEETDTRENEAGKEPVDLEDIDIEAEVLQIREWYYGLEDNLDNLESGQASGIKCYYDAGVPVKIVVEKGQDGWDYTREYYYHDGKFYFAFVYNGAEEHRLYFKEKEMIRYIDENGDTYDYGSNDNYSDWKEKVLKEAEEAVSSVR